MSVGFSAVLEEEEAALTSFPAGAVSAEGLLLGVVVEVDVFEVVVLTGMFVKLVKDALPETIYSAPSSAIVSVKVVEEEEVPVREKFNSLDSGKQNPETEGRTAANTAVADIHFIEDKPIEYVRTR